MSEEDKDSCCVPRCKYTSEGNFTKKICEGCKKDGYRFEKGELYDWLVKDKKEEPLCRDMLTLRDYFAAKAMTAMVAQERNIIAMAAENGAREEIVKDAYLVADAMLTERSRK